MGTGVQNWIFPIITYIPFHINYFRGVHAIHVKCTDQVTAMCMVKVQRHGYSLCDTALSQCMVSQWHNHSDHMGQPEGQPHNHWGAVVNGWFNKFHQFTWCKLHISSKLWNENRHMLCNINEYILYISNQSCVVEAGTFSCVFIYTETYLSGVNSLVPGDILMKLYTCNFQTDFSDLCLRHLLWNYPNMNLTWLHQWSVNIGSGNGLVPSGSKPLPETMLTQIYLAIWHQ